MKKFLAVIFCVGALNAGFTLEQAQRYAAFAPELVKPQVGSFVFNPDYAHFHRFHGRSVYDRIASLFGFAPRGWSPRTFTQALTAVNAQRVLPGPATPHSAVLTVEQGAQVIIFGPLFGAYHSLVRSLSELYAQGMIDDGLRILKDNTYVVFTGNITNGSPYNMETMTLVMALMHANPEQVIFVAGEQETGDSWLGYGLKNELDERAPALWVHEKLSRLFASLPRVLFVKIKDQQEYVMIGNTMQAGPCELPGKALRLYRCPLDGEQDRRFVRAVIAGEDRLMSYKNHAGLVQAPARDGAQTWAVFSAPNKVYRTYYQFEQDAFAVLTLGGSLGQSVLSLYNQDVRVKAGFKLHAQFALLTGKDLSDRSLQVLQGEHRFIPQLSLMQRIAACQQMTAQVLGEHAAATELQEPIYMGCTLDLSKGISPMGKLLRAGIELRINKLNSEGGLNGRPVKMVFMDDEYSPERARRNVEEFLERYKSPLFLCNLGSPTTQAYLDLIKDEKIFLFFPSTGAPLFRHEHDKGTVHWRASYSAEGRILTKYMKDEMGIRNVALLYQNDAYGQGALEGAQDIIGGTMTATNVPYERNTTSFDIQIEKVKQASVAGIGFFATSLASAEFIRQAGVDFFIGKKLFGLSDLAEESFRKFLSLRGLSMVVAQFVPNPATSQLQLVREYRQELAKQGDMTTDVFSLEGYMSASLALYILRQAEQPTPQGINKVLPTIHDTSYKGLALSFNANTRELAHDLWVDSGGPEWVQQDTKVTTVREST